MKKLRIVLAQINPSVGDIDGNTGKICDYIRNARGQRADVIVFPELAITGYPPEDLLLKPHFIDDNIDGLSRVAAEARDITVVIGFVDRQNNVLYNAAALITGRKITNIYHKLFLPNYGVFDEYRYFRAGAETPVYNIKGISVGINICEDIWYPEGPAKYQALAGAEVILNINASPYHMEKAHLREKMVSERASDNNVIIAYLNTVGGQDELVFDGGSFIADKSGEIICRGKQFEEEMIIYDLTAGEVNSGDKKNIVPRAASLEEEIYKALVLGTRDYTAKNGFRRVVIGLSGGIDSSLVAAIAVDAVGKENVTGIFMPSPYTSDESRVDAYALAENLGIKIIEVPVSSIFQAYLDNLKSQFNGRPEDITEENLQARIRGNILMSFSNKFGWLVLTTGNKSEMSVGYATLYGDMAGGFAVIKDVPKTLVFKISEWKNLSEGREIIPERVLSKEPSAELRPGQKDTDSLPPYHVLDPILKAYIEEDKSFEDILSMKCGSGCTKDAIQKIIQMVDRSEYKRRQSPPGIKITPRAFGKDRRFPITNKYRSF